MSSFRAIHRWRTFVSLVSPVHRFFEGRSTRDRLYCSVGQFLLVMTHHQVMSAYVDFLAPFGQQAEELEFNLVRFVHENKHEEHPPQTNTGVVLPPERGRSWREIRHCYSLRAAEPIDDKDGDGAGAIFGHRIRPAAVYHSFDVDSGKAFWATTNANGELKSRVERSSRTHPTLRPASLRKSSSTGGAFSATFTTHLLVFEWCAEGWSRYISLMERDVRPLLQAARNRPLDFGSIVEPAVARRTGGDDGQTPGLGPGDVLRRRVSTTGLSKPAALTHRCTGISVWDLARSAKSRLIGNRDSSAASDHGGPGNANAIVADPARAPKAPRNEKRMDQFSLLNDFTFPNYQQLYRTGHWVRDALLALRINACVICQVREYYEDLLRCPNFPTGIKHDCASQWTSFIHRIKAIEADLAIHQARAQA